MGVSLAGCEACARGALLLQPRRGPAQKPILFRGWSSRSCRAMYRAAPVKSETICEPSFNHVSQMRSQMLLARRRRSWNPPQRPLHYPLIHRHFERFSVQFSRERPCVVVYLSICLSIYLSIYLPVCLSTYLSIYLSIHQSIYVSIYL